MAVDAFLITGYWWLVVTIFGLAVFPIVFSIFNFFKDRGWAFSRTFGILLVSYLVWIMGALQVLPFSRIGIFTLIALVGVVSVVFLKRSTSAMQSFINKEKKLILVEELFFLVLILGWSFIRAHNPDINGLEKFMDFGFMNSILRSDFFPPKDMWLAGETINYYYFGHLTAAVLTKASGLLPSVTYNLMIATILALSFIEAFSLGLSLVSFLFLRIKSGGLVFVSGLVSALVLNFAGNLHTLISVIGKGAKNYWYPDATRYIAYTIHEFPIYSYVVSDLHGHVSDIPNVLMVLAVMISLLYYFEKLIGSFLFSTKMFPRLVIFSWLLGILYMTNALDAFIYLGLFVFLIFLISLKKNSFLVSAWRLMQIAAITGFLTFLFSLPFHMSFKPFAEGIKLVQTRSPIDKLLVLWGFFLMVGLVFLIVYKIANSQKVRIKHLKSLGIIIFFGIMFFSVILVIVPEVVYIKDIYIEEYHRANTMFKLVYQTFILMSLLSGPVFVGLIKLGFSSEKVNLKLIGFLLLIYIFGLGSVLVYPYYAIDSYYGGLKNYQGLDGLSWMEKKYPDDYAALVWLRENVEGQPVILEAVGESYTDFARISANTGMPTVLGWRVHEWLWRGSFDEAGKRTEVVADIYGAIDVEQACKLIDLYSVDYLFLGKLEREQYPQMNEGILLQIGKQIFIEGKTKILKVNQPCKAPASMVSF